MRAAALRQGNSKLRLKMRLELAQYAIETSRTVYSPSHSTPFASITSTPVRSKPRSQTTERREITERGRERGGEKNKGTNGEMA